MTLTLYWWLWPAAAMVGAVIVLLTGPDSDWDFWPILKAGGFVLLAIGLFVGHFL
jgi:hypothetical protein